MDELLREHNDQHIPLYEATSGTKRARVDDGSVPVDEPMQQDSEMTEQDDNPTVTTKHVMYDVAQVLQQQFTDLRTEYMKMPHVEWITGNEDYMGCYLVPETRGKKSALRHCRICCHEVTIGGKRLSNYAPHLIERHPALFNVLSLNGNKLKQLKVVQQSVLDSYKSRAIQYSMQLW